MLGEKKMLQNVHLMHLALEELYLAGMNCPWQPQAHLARLTLPTLLLVHDLKREAVWQPRRRVVPKEALTESLSLPLGDHPTSPAAVV